VLDLPREFDQISPANVAKGSYLGHDHALLQAAASQTMPYDL
jgi:hypothetical protein